MLGYYGYIEGSKDNEHIQFELCVNNDGLIEYEFEYPISEMVEDDKEAILNILGRFDNYEHKGVATWSDLTTDTQKYFETKSVNKDMEVLIAKAKLVSKTVICSGNLIVSMNTTTNPTPQGQAPLLPTTPTAYPYRIA